MNLLDEIIIRRTYYNAYYIAIAIIVVMAVYVAHRYRFVRFSGYLYVVATAICLLWELSLFLTGARHYNPG